MDPSDFEPSKALPSAITELQRILHGAQDAGIAAAERTHRALNEESPAGSDTCNRIKGAKALAEAIRQEIQKCGVSFVFGSRLGEVWPAEPPHRDHFRTRAIRDFAAERGWQVFLMNDGHMAMFRPEREER